jgi:hypothetical protein
VSLYTGLSSGAKSIIKDYSSSHSHELLSFLGNSSPKPFELMMLYIILFSLVEEISAVSLDISTSRKDINGYGSFSFNFPSGTFKRDQATLVTRTKIVLVGGYSGLLPALISAEISDFLFQLISKGSDVPLSKFVEGFLSISKFIHYDTDFFLRSSLPLMYVHTYTILSPLSSGELAAWNAASDISDTPALKMFYRDISLYSPSPRPSVFTFADPPPFQNDLGTLLLRAFSTLIRSLQ